MQTFETSKRKLQDSQQYLAGGVASTLRASMKPTPLFAVSGSGPRIQDVDGNAYIDYLLAYGPLILGHAHPAITESVYAAMKNGVSFGLQHDGEIQLARLLTEVLPCAEKVALSGSGTEAVMLALRLARAHTGKQKVIRFHGHYHGWSDAIFTSFSSADMKQSSISHGAAVEQVQPGTGGQSVNSLDDIILLPWNDPVILEATLRQRHHEIAAIISEPVMCNSGCIMPQPGYLELIRTLTEEMGIVMILDEVITGFRLSLGGAHGKFKLMPDLVTVGKALGGGIAVSAVAGRADIMHLIETGEVSHLGTLNGNAVATAAAIATIHELAKNDGQMYRQLEQTANHLVQGIRDLLLKHKVPGIVNQVGPVFHFMFTEETEVKDFMAFNKRDAAKYSRFAEYMLSEGVLIRTNGLWYVSTVHSDVEIQETLMAVDKVLSGIAAE